MRPDDVWRHGRPRLASSVLPLPIQDFRHIDTMLMNVLFVLDEFVAQQLLEMSTDALQFGHAVYGVSCKMESVQFIHYRHVEWRCRRAFFFIAAYVQVVMIVAAISQPVNQPRISVI